MPALFVVLPVPELGDLRDDGSTGPIPTAGIVFGWPVEGTNRSAPLIVPEMSAGGRGIGKLARIYRVRKFSLRVVGPEKPAEARSGSGGIRFIERDLFDEAAAGADVVLGRRFSRSSVLINYPLQKILCNRSFHFLLSLVFRRKLRDVTNNLKLMRRDVVDSLELESAWFAATAETGLKPILMGYDVRPVAISWINRTPEMGSSSFSLLKNGLGYARILASLAWRSRFGARPLPRRPRAAAGAEGPGAGVV